MPTASVSRLIRVWISGAAASISAAWSALGGLLTILARSRNGVIRATKSAGSSARILSPLIASSFRTSNWAGFLFTRARSNSAARSARRELLPVIPGRPAEQGQVVVDRLGQEAFLAVPVDRDDAVPLGQPLAVLAQHVGQMGEHREVGLGHAHGPVHGDLPRRGGQQVLAAHHMGDLHQHVVHRDGQRVQRRAVRPGQHEVRHVRVIEGDLAADQVGERGRSLAASGTGPPACGPRPGTRRPAPRRAPGSARRSRSARRRTGPPRGARPVPPGCSSSSRRARSRSR